MTVYQFGGRSQLKNWQECPFGVSSDGYERSDGCVKMGKMRRILHIDMDAFFSSVEQKRRPELIGNPVVIGGDGDPTKRGVVSTASYEARKYGIHSAMPLRTAYNLCPNAIFLPVDHEEYSRISKMFKAVLVEFTQTIERRGN